MPIALSDMSATKIGEYQVIIFGGCSSAQLSCDFYDGCSYCPASSDRSFEYNAIDNRWRELASSIRPRYRHAAAYYDGELFVGGGRSVDDDSVLSQVDVYNLFANSWSSLDLSFIDVPRSDLAAIAFNGYLFFVGGYDADYTAQSSSIGINLDSGAPMSFPALSVARGDFGLVHDDTTAYAVGGWSHENWCSPLDSVEILSITAYPDSQWNNAPSLAVPRGDKGAALVDGRFYVAGGEHNNNCATGSEPVDDVEVLDSEQGQWIPVADVPEPKFRTVAIGLGPYLLVFGGQSSRQESDACPSDVEYCYPVTDHVYRLTLTTVDDDHNHDDCDHNHNRPLSRIAFFFLGLASGLVLALLLYLLVLLCKRCRKPFSKTASHEAVTMLHIKGLTNSQFEHESIEEDLDESKGVELGSV